MTAPLLAALCVVVAVVTALLVFFVTTVVSRREQRERAVPLRSPSSPTFLPQQITSGEDLRALRFRTARRGYHPEDVDWALEQIAQQWDTYQASHAGSTAQKFPINLGENTPHERQWRE